MTANDFFEHFATLADAPGGIPKLRELNLQMAIQGKLCPQQFDDEPVSHFLASIDAQKTATSNERRQRNVEPGLPVNESEQSFSIPPNWTWKRFADVTINRDGERIPIESGIRESRRGEFDYYGASGVIDKIDDYLFDKPLLLIGEDGANLVNRSTPIAFIAKGKFWVNNHAHVLDSTSLDALRYLEVFINAIDLKPYLTGTAQPKMNQGKMNSIAVAVPPLAEQKRIVAKTDRLMALCDALEAQQQARHAVRSRLYATLLGNLQTAANAADFARAWQRLRDHFAELFTPGEAALDAVTQLRQTILQLAVQGKLVPQDGQSATRVHKAIPLTHIPPSWCCDPLGDLVDPRFSISYGVLVPGQDTTDGVPFVRLQDLALRDHPERPNKSIAADIEAPYARTRLLGGEILLGVVGSIGKLGIVPEFWAGANIARAICRIVPGNEISREFLLVALQSPPVQKFFLSSTRTLAQPTLNVGLIVKTPIPLPPLAEQQRIVTKVLQLMAHCDTLEASLNAAATVSERWSAAAVRQLLDGAARPIAAR